MDKDVIHWFRSNLDHTPQIFRAKIGFNPPPPSLYPSYAPDPMIELLNPKIESLALGRSSSDPNDSILGFNDLILGFNDLILGFNDLTSGFNDSILGFNDSTSGFNDSILGFNGLLLGFNYSILGFNDLFARKSARYNTTLKI